MNPELPKYYVEWLSRLATGEPLSYMEKDWYLYSMEELNENIEIDSYSTPAFMQLESFLKTQLEMTGETPISIEKARDLVTIGENNGDPLFYDKTDDSVRCY